MRLTRVQIQGFKRFLEPTSMEVSEDVVCILGPNGSGKSSFLEALVYLNSDGEFVPSDLSRVRGAGPVPGIVATFELTSRDREELTDVPEAKEAVEFSVHKEADGALKYSMSPRPRRDRTKRKRAITALKKLAKSKGPERIDEYESQGEEAPTASIRGSLDDCLTVLATEEENLSDGELATLDELRVRLSTFVEDDAVTGGVEASRSPVAPIRALEALSAAVEGENEEHPYDRSIGALVPLVPTFLKFDEQSRDLRSEYDLNEGAPDPGPAIKNLLRLGGTSWESAAQVASSGDMGMKKAWIESVDGALKEKIGGAWGQQRLDVSVDIDGRVLRVFLKMKSSDFIDIAWQSDGIRQFVALRTFIAQEELSVKPIILIDEAEQHLHYDAQANLVTVLEEQEDTSKVIYTTHSAGCLPRDIAVGTRGIAPNDDGDFSKVINQFWAQDSGMSPILIGMGAGAFAFSSARRALVTEGFTDALVLPRLIREATGTKHLRYQIVPHFAKSSLEGLEEFDLLAARVAFVADGDQGGRDKSKLILQAGFAEKQVIYLGASDTSGLSLEDLIDRNVFITAVSEETGEERIKQALEATDQKKLPRWAWMESVLDECDVRPPSKSAVAKRVMRASREQRIVDEAAREHLIALDKAAWQALKQSFR